MRNYINFASNENGAVFKRNGCETVTVNESIYADDTICAFVDREDLILNVPILYETFEQCGMEIHIKKPTDKKAKTVADAGHFSRSISQRSYSIADTIGGYPVHQATSAGAA